VGLLAWGDCGSASACSALLNWCGAMCCVLRGGATVGLVCVGDYWSAGTNSVVEPLDSSRSLNVDVTAQRALRCRK
jgi:hypothetical protein